MNHLLKYRALLKKFLINVAFLDSLVFNQLELKEFKVLFEKYVKNDKNKELEVLYAAQSVADELKHPKGDTLYITIDTH